MSRKSKGATAAAEENLFKLKKHLLDFTCRLIRLDRNKNILGIASGFFAKASEQLILFSAGHALKKNDWFLETNVTFEDTNQTILIPLQDIWCFEEHTIKADLTLRTEDCEFAFGLIDQQLLYAEAKKDPRLAGKRLEFTYYQGPLTDEPVPQKEPYAYCSWNKVLFLRAFKSFLERDATGEFFMSYEGRTGDGKLHRFKLAGSHQGDAYYDGASGSPIVDPEGKVVSMRSLQPEIPESFGGLSGG